MLVTWSGGMPLERDGDRLGFGVVAEGFFAHLASPAGLFVSAEG